MPRRQDVKDDIIHLRSAGVDLGERFLLACVRTPSSKRADSWSLETERFGTITAETRRLLAWLVDRQVEVVVMAATSDYWRGVYCRLQPHLNLMLVNPAHLKGIRGRKTDPTDAAFLARAGASGMVMASFVSQRDIRELRDLTRRRTELVRAAGWEAQRLEKELEHTGMKLSAVLSDMPTPVAGPSWKPSSPGSVILVGWPTLQSAGPATRSPPSSRPWTGSSPNTTPSWSATTWTRSTAGRRSSPASMPGSPG
jgi:hypothetical protein